VTDLLLKDLVHIPESVQQSDFVVKLTGDVKKPEAILGSYVVTDDIAQCFDQALDLVGSSIRDRSSKGAYLHGSFGSGKSHFMAVLHLLLEGNAQARALPRLAPVIAKHDSNLEGRKILLVPYHMVGKESMEAGVLGGYVEHVRKLHPTAPMPPVYASDLIFDNAQNLREKLGDDSFFGGLGQASDDLAGFGDLATGWDASSFDAAVAMADDSEERRRLTADLIDTYFTSYADLAESKGGGYIPFDDGLAAISTHAKSLGYDGILLFLDELVLWLASRMSDPDFVTREGGKVGLLVEGSGNRPVPIISLIARQRDLKDFIGEGVAGVEKQSFTHNLEYWDSRFDKIVLSDTNLPAIVEERLLKPSSESARAELDRAFSSFTDRADRALDTLMTDESDKQSFRRCYPFSPALINVLVGVSAFLQRERTSLKMLSQLLVDNRDTLTVGQIVPLGDLWDVVDGAEEPMDGALRRHFSKARQLYHGKLRPLILDQYGLTEEEAAAVPAGHQLRADDRLARTLLLAALVPDVEAVRGMTVGRLTDLNHGSIRSPIPGMERQRVHATLQNWGGRIGELRLDGDDLDQSVSLKLVGVDVTAIIDKASTADTEGTRIRMVRDLLAEAFAVNVGGTLTPEVTVTHLWRGRKRQVDLLFGNVRNAADVPDSEFRSTIDRPKIIVDHPFDVDGKGPSDDIARIQDLRQTIGEHPTLCWIPLTLTVRARDDLGKLVILEHLMTRDRLDQYTSDLQATQRIEAKEVLRAQRQQLRASVMAAIKQAYGVTKAGESVRQDLDLESQFTAVDPALDIRPPKAPTLHDAFHELLDQLWTQIAPAHPKFPDEVRKGDLARTLELVTEAAAQPDRRLEVAPNDRRLLIRVIAPLELGTVGEAHMVLGREWRDRFSQEWSAAGKPPRTVENLRSWTDRPVRRLLDDEVLSLIVSAYAVEDDLAIELDSVTMEPSIGVLSKRAELVSVALPPVDAWMAAVRRGQTIFGVAGSPVVSASNVSMFARRIREQVVARRPGTVELLDVVGRWSERFGVASESARRRTAVAAGQLLADVQAAGDDLSVVGVLAAFESPSSDEVTARSITSAADIGLVLRNANQDLLAGAFAKHEGAVLGAAFTAALGADEFAAGLREALTIATRDATKLLVASPVPPAPSVDQPAPGGVTPVTPAADVPLLELVGSTATMSIGGARAKLAELEGQGVTEVTLGWVGR
jgi:hypothetical protein